MNDIDWFYYATQTASMLYFLLACFSVWDSMAWGVVFLLMAIFCAVLGDFVKGKTQSPIA